MLTHQAGGGRAASAVAGQTPDPPEEISWSPGRRADATKPAELDDCPTHTHTHACMHAHVLVQTQTHLEVQISCDSIALDSKQQLKRPKAAVCGE